MTRDCGLRIDKAGIQSAIHNPQSAIQDCLGFVQMILAWPGGGHSAWTSSPRAGTSDKANVEVITSRRAGAGCHRAGRGMACDRTGRMSQQQQQHHQETPSADSPACAHRAGPVADAWDALSAFEDDLPASTEASAATAAAANAAAVEAAADVARDERVALPSQGGAFTLPLLCGGIAIIAACLLIPQADANRRLAYERLKLQADLQAVEKQVQVNDEFLSRVADDANLAERLAQRQMKIIRQGNHVLNLKNGGDTEMSPFQLTAVAPPADLPPYQPRGGLLARLCYNSKSRLYLIGVGLMAMAGGLVLGLGPRKSEDLVPISSLCEPPRDGTKTRG